MRFWEISVPSPLTFQIRRMWLISGAAQGLSFWQGDVLAARQRITQLLVGLKYRESEGLPQLGSHQGGCGVVNETLLVLFGPENGPSMAWGGGRKGPSSWNWHQNECSSAGLLGYISFLPLHYPSSPFFWS